MTNTKQHFRDQINADAWFYFLIILFAKKKKKHNHDKIFQIS